MSSMARAAGSSRADSSCAVSAGLSGAPRCDSAVWNRSDLAQGLHLPLHIGDERERRGGDPQGRNDDSEKHESAHKHSFGERVET